MKRITHLFSISARRTHGHNGAKVRPLRPRSDEGFSIIEATIAMLLMMIVALGTASLFSFSIYNNSGGSDRAVSLALAQQAMEGLRGATFNGTTTDAQLNAGTVVQNGVLRDGRSFRVTKTIVDTAPTL